jgi:hypothetical protein
MKVVQATVSAKGVRVRIPRWLGPVLIYAFSVACLVWVYHDFDWHAEWPRLKRIHWSWVLLAVVCDIMVYVSQAWRWNLLLEPVVKVPLGRSVQAIYIGLFANELLPLRSGEAIRCYLQSVWSQISFAVSISSALIERFLDGVWLILGFLAVTFFVHLDSSFKYGASILTMLVCALALLLAYAIHRRDEAQDALSRYRWLSGLRHLVEGLHTMGRSRTFLYGALASLVYLALQVVPIFAMMKGYGLDLSFGHAAVVLVVLRLGTIIPGPPGNIGLFNAFAVAGLTMLGVAPQTAKGLSGVMFFIITVPLLLAGCVAVALAGFKLRELQKKAHSHINGEAR